jgi:glycerate 2-kinase
MPTPDWNRWRADLEALHGAALAAADPAGAVERHLRLEGRTLHAGPHAIPLESGARVYLVAFGKAAAGMARAASAILGDRVAAGVVVQPHGAREDGPWPRSIHAFSAAHPVPDQGSLSAGQAVIELLADTRERDVVLALVSGGGSALLEALRPGIGLDDLQALTRALQHAGADIVALNTVRRAISRLKGGGLARLAAPATIVALLLSDVMGDRPEAIASGPTVPSPTSPRDALRVLESTGVASGHPRVVAALERDGDTPTPALPHAMHVIVGSNRLAAEAAAHAARDLGFQTLIVTQYLQGEAHDAGRVIGGMGRTCRETGHPQPPPLALIFGGETTVTVRGRGRGGRNLELALGVAQSIAGTARTALLAFGTDGVDGASDAAGAFATGETLARARAEGLSVEAALADNDSDPFFRRLGDLWITGPTGTNVNDLAIVLVYP